MLLAAVVSQLAIVVMLPAIVVMQTAVFVMQIAIVVMRVAVFVSQFSIGVSQIPIGVMAVGTVVPQCITVVMHRSLLYPPLAHRTAASNRAQPSAVRRVAAVSPRKRPTRRAGAGRPARALPFS